MAQGHQPKSSCQTLLPLESLELHRFPGVGVGGKGPPGPASFRDKAAGTSRAEATTGGSGRTRGGAPYPGRWTGGA